MTEVVNTSITLTSETSQRLDQLALRKGANRHALIRMAINDLLERETGVVVIEAGDVIRNRGPGRLPEPYHG